MAKLQESVGRYWLTIPKAIVKAKRWGKGTLLKIEFDAKGNLVIKEE